ncbi:unnamed protein product [Adineta steineri]|uniref:Uncharacterized protein n=1 Tax=Adineta steineri TaxID=433720 RepID=A0A815DQG8_9BILA|nr:unnamed protein product [Adineta steineri]CAF3569639.1 unnamed protein product [Adineta steineri]
MICDISDKQTEKLINETIDMENQWQLLIEGLNTLKERHLSTDSMNSSYFNQYEDLTKDIEYCLISARQLINEQEQININILSDNDQLLSKIKKCEEELNNFKNTIDSLTTDAICHSLIHELAKVSTSIITMRMQLENRIEQQYSFINELETFANWLKKFTNQSKTIDEQTIELFISQQQEHFNELTKFKQENDVNINEQIQNLIHMWNDLLSMTTNSQNIVTTQLSSTCVDEHQHNIVEQAQKLLSTNIQLGNRREIEQLKNKITV